MLVIGITAEIKTNWCKTSKRDNLCKRAYLPLITASLFLTLIALSHHVSFGSREIMKFEISEVAYFFLSIIRSSGRMFWPAHYLILYFATALVVKNFSKMKAISICSFLLIFQIWDMSFAFTKIKEGIEHKDDNFLEPRLKSPFWNLAVKKGYRQIVFVPNHNAIADYEYLAYFAAINKISINGGYFARYNRRNMVEENKLYVDQLTNDNFEKQTIYVINDQELWTKIKDHNFAKEVDNYRLLASDWE